MDTQKLYDAAAQGEALNIEFTSDADKKQATQTLCRLLKAVTKAPVVPIIVTPNTPEVKKQSWLKKILHYGK